MHKTLIAAVRRALHFGEFDVTPEGLFVPSQHVMVAGEYTTTVNGEDLQVCPNRIVDEGLNYLVNVGFHTLPKIANWYLAPFAANVSPAANWTAATFPATASEITSNTEGYSQTNRQKFNSTAAAAGGTSVNNLTGGKASFTIVTAGELTITGMALLSDQLKGSTSGVLASATKFPTARKLVNGDVFDVGYSVTLNAA